MASSGSADSPPSSVDERRLKDAIPEEVLKRSKEVQIQEKRKTIGVSQQHQKIHFHFLKLIL